jgi:endonuclease YncB( thermonuclease family)
VKRIVILSLFAIVAWAQPLAKVVKVMDGDTFEVSDGTKVRLHCIDAPELSQPGGEESRVFLSVLLSGQTVGVDKKGIDKYGRTIAEVTVNGSLVNLSMVEMGQAWRFVQYCKDDRYEAAEKTARGASAGLWASANPVAPWDYRHPQVAPVSARAIAVPDKPKAAASAGGLMRGPKGGCYYLTPSGSKRYVSRSACD